MMTLSGEPGATIRGSLMLMASVPVDSVVDEAGDEVVFVPPELAVVCEAEVVEEELAVGWGPAIGIATRKAAPIITTIASKPTRALTPDRCLSKECRLRVPEFISFPQSKPKFSSDVDFSRQATSCPDPDSLRGHGLGRRSRGSPISSSVGLSVFFLRCAGARPRWISLTSR
jgi:hypothetical protein